MLATGGRNSLGGNNDSVLEGWPSNANLTYVIRHSGEAVVQKYRWM